MKYGVIDVGSNSVRLMISDGVNTISKTVRTTQLAEGLSEEGYLQPLAIERTALTVSFFCDAAKKQGADEIFIFATAAVRQAKNANELLAHVKLYSGLDVDVISGEEEAMFGYMGALDGKDGGVIDVGGASAEVIYVENGKVAFTKSVPLGAVKIKDLCGQNKEKASVFISRRLKAYGKIPQGEYYAIGGTATSLAAIMQELDPYDPLKVNGFVITTEELGALADRLYSMNLTERRKLKGLQPKRASVIAGGTLLLYKIVKKIGVDKIIISESDNLEGYLAHKLVKL